jgi:hypothetical protein
MLNEKTVNKEDVKLNKNIESEEALDYLLKDEL